jgi:hypothetical protein
LLSFASCLFFLDVSGGGQTCRPLTSPRRSMLRAVIFANADGPSSGVECNLATLSPFAITIDLNLIVFAEAAHALLGSTIAVTGDLAGAVEQPCDLSIRHQPGPIRERAILYPRKHEDYAGRPHSVAD